MSTKFNDLHYISIQYLYIVNSKIINKNIYFCQEQNNVSQFSCIITAVAPSIERSTCILDRFDGLTHYALY